MEPEGKKYSNTVHLTPMMDSGKQTTISGAHAARAGLIEILEVQKLEFADGDFDSQVEELLGYIRLSREQVLRMSRLYNDLEETLALAWPGCRVHAFGSIVTGLAIKTSDADVFIEIPSGEVEIDPQACVRIARNIFDHFPDRFRNTFMIPKARIPIVQFYYAPIDINCDVSFSAKSGPINSNLIGILLSLDQRALHLAIILKYWSKVHYLTGTNLVPNYAYTLMIIFFLQQQKILPPLKPYINNSYVIADWDYGYDHEGLRNYKIQNNSTLLQLIVAFFCYYRDFDHEKYIISPYLGYPMERERFIGKKPIAPEEFPLYVENKKKGNPLKVNGFICVQDIFEHNRNCSISVWNKQFTKFTAFITNTADLFEKYVHTENFSTYLKDILTNVPPHYANTVKLMPRKKYYNLKKSKKKRDPDWRIKAAEKWKAKAAEKRKLGQTMKKKKKKKKKTKDIV